MSIFVIILYIFCKLIIKFLRIFMVEYIQECRDESEIINFFKLRGKILNKDDINKLKANYKYFTTEKYNKNQLTLKQLDKIAGGFYLYKLSENIFELHKGILPNIFLKKLCNGKEDYERTLLNPKFIPIIDISKGLLSEDKEISLEDCRFVPIGSSLALYQLVRKIDIIIKSLVKNKKDELTNYDFIQIEAFAQLKENVHLAISYDSFVFFCN